MNRLAKSLLIGLLEDESKVIAFYGGGFKPPTKGHFEVVKKTLQDYPEITKFYIVIGSGVRNGITQKESKAIWEIYQPYLSDKIEIVEAQSPLKYISTYTKENPDIKIYVAIGTREGDEDDAKDFIQRKEFFSKSEGNIEVLNIVTGGGVSGTKARKFAGESKEEFFKYLPNEITDEEREQIYNYISPVLKENQSTQENFDYAPYLKSLVSYMINQGLQIQPLPKVKFITRDTKNALDFFGKTAYYDPENQTITLYTFGRLPKDVLRSFAHEMIHHKQKLENKIGGGVIKTTNIHDDPFLKEMEEEAFLTGNMMFRGWSDSKNPNKMDITLHEIFLDIPKFNHPKTIQEHLNSTLNEIILNPDNAVDIEGNLTDGKFTVGNQTYIYNIKEFPTPSYYRPGLFYNIEFHPKGNPTSEPQGGKENYVKILSTMYKIILDFTQQEQPEYIGIASLDNQGSKNYHSVYANLTDNKSNRIPGYFRKDVSLRFNGPRGSGRMIVLKKSTKPLNEGRYDKISNTVSSQIFNQWKQDFTSKAKKGFFEETYVSNGIEFDIIATLKFIPNSESLKVDGGLEETEDGYTIYVDFEIDPESLPEMWSEISMNLKDVIRHEIEHITQSNIEIFPSKYIEDDQFMRNLIQMDLLPSAQYFKLEKEIDAQLQGMYFRAKKEKRPLIDVLNAYLDLQDITPEQKEEILDIWRTRAKALSLPKF